MRSMLVGFDAILIVFDLIFLMGLFGSLYFSDGIYWDAKISEDCWQTDEW